MIHLLRFTGEDQPGQTAAIAARLAAHGAVVLDINQTVVHDLVLLAMMVRLPPPETMADAEVVLAEVERIAETKGLRTRHAPVSDDEYRDWVARQGRPRYLLTLLARWITADKLSAVTDVIRDHGLNIDIITRLSGRPSLDAVQQLDLAAEAPCTDVAPHTHAGLREPDETSGGASGGGIACVEFQVRGEPADPQRFRGDLLRLSRERDIDLAWQKDDAYRRTRRMVIFDMDSTLIQHEVIDELAHRAGAGGQVAAITEAAMRGEIEFDDSLRQRVATLEGMPETILEEVADSLRLTEGAESLIRNLHDFGYKTAVLSGGFGYFARRLQQRLGLDEVRANELEIVNGHLTGRVVGAIVNGRRKAELLDELAAQHGLRREQVVAVGDGANDLPMLARAGLGIAFHAKPVVQESSDHRISTLGLDAILFLLGVRERERV